jgi:hypothetical protein
MEQLSQYGRHVGLDERCSILCRDRQLHRFLISCKEYWSAADYSPPFCGDVKNASKDLRNSYRDPDLRQMGAAENGAQKWAFVFQTLVIARIVTILLGWP